MSNTTVGKIVKELMQDELVIEVGQLEGDIGKDSCVIGASALVLNEFLRQSGSE